MDLRVRFVDDLRRRSDGHMLDLRPAELATAAAHVTGATAGGLTLVQPLVRLPIGASDADAEVAEQVQASLGSGPCLEAVDARAPLAADEVDLVASWPMYHRLLVERTRFRAVASFPMVQPGGAVFAALDLYSDDPVWTLSCDLVTIQRDVADLVGMMLLGSILGQAGRASWPGDERALRRQQVWVAVGMVCEASAVSDADAMAMLRAYAFASDRLLDDVAEEMLTGDLHPEAVLGRR